jgi:predicted transcriptional regulator of viral defense system
MPLDVICKTAGTNYNTTRGVLGRLVKRKVVQHVGKGLYQITRTAA